MVILQQDDCAPDALHTFQVAMHKDLGISRADFIALGEDVSESDYETVVVLGNFRLCQSADSPFWELSEDTSIPDNEIVYLKMTQTAQKIVEIREKILQTNNNLPYWYEKLVSMSILGKNLSELYTKIEEIKKFKTLLDLSPDLVACLDLAKNEIERHNRLAKDLVKKINRLEIKY